MPNEVLKLEKERLNGFLEKIKDSYELVAPVKSDAVRFKRIDDISSIYLERNSDFPLKEYFFRKNEVLFSFNGGKIMVPGIESPKRVFFGIRRCDLNAINRQDFVFMQQVKDPYYTAMRQNSFLIGYHCSQAPSEFCFCGSMGLKDHFDLMLYDREGYFLVEVGSEKGKFLAGKFKEFFSRTEMEMTEKEKSIPMTDRLKRKDISGLYGHPGWKKAVEMCLSCAACTNLCPTCYCFEIFDEASTENTLQGARKRKWSSCQLPEFTRVANDHIFRQEREERFKHRIYHQLDYFRQKNGFDLCVGCGRCIEACPTRIDFVRIMNEMRQ